MILGNRRLLITAGIGSAMALALFSTGNQLFTHSWFQNFAASAWIYFPVMVLAFFAFFGTPLLFILVVWRWEPSPRSWPVVLLRWFIGVLAAVVGWFLTMAVITGGANPFAFFRETLFAGGNILFIVGATAFIGFLDWFFFTRHWKKVVR